MKTLLLNNRYRILQTLGRGGFGETFLAIDTHMPSGRKCAIKQLKPAVQTPEMPQWMQERFQREAAILEELGESHSQIPRLYAYFSEGGNFYLVQEWIEGVTLTQKQQQQGNLSESEVRKILVSLLPVLAHIHSRRIVHRDVKPDNIILRAVDGKPVLIDFGIVKETIATGVNHSQNTPFSMGIGTPGYMSSEQAAGRPVYSSDLYSLGLTAVYLLTGKTPQNLETDSRTGEILWRKEAPALHSHLATVIDKTIRFHPRDRFSSAKEMLAKLQSPAENATAATVAVSPGKLPSTANPTRTKPLTGRTVALTSPPVEKGNSWLNWGLPLLLIGGIGGGAFALGFSLFSPKERSRPIVFPESRVQTFPQIEFPSPEASPTPEPETPPEPSPETSPETSPKPPEVIVESIRKPSPQPKPTPEKNRGSSIRVPIFVTGTKDSQLLEALGEPTSNRKGYWSNSRAWLYQDVVPNQVDLGYLFDTNTGRLRQTEVSFAQSVGLGVMQKTLNDLLGGNAPGSVEGALKQVYQRKTDLRSFRVGNFKGMIKRNQKDRIYIGIWEANFH